MVKHIFNKVMKYVFYKETLLFYWFVINYYDQNISRHVESKFYFGSLTIKTYISLKSPHNFNLKYLSLL